MVHRPLVPTAWLTRPPQDAAPPRAADLSRLLADSNLRHDLTPDQFRELSALSAESNPALLTEALFSLGRRLEASHQESAALSLYQAVRELEGEGGAAAARIEAISGRGPWQNRIETLGRRFVRQATDPAMILSFAIAGGLAQTVRRGVLASLALRGPNLLTRGLGARAVAGGLAYIAEVPAFVGAGRLWRAATGAETAEPPLGQELLGAGLFLGVLKLSGFAGHEILARTTRNPALLSGGAAASGFGGIYLAHRLQEGAGLRPAQDEANRWVDSADAWLQMRVGGSLVGANPLHGSLDGGLRRAVAAPHPVRVPEISRASHPRLPIAASYHDAISPRGTESDAGTPIEFTPTRHLLSQRFGLETLRGLLPEIRGVAHYLGIDPARLEALFQSSNLEKPEVAAAGWQRLHHAVQHSDAEGARGSYFNFLTRRLSERIVSAEDPAALLSLFTFLHEGGTLDGYERFAAWHMVPLQAGARVIELAPLQHLNALPVLPELRAVLRRYVLRGGRVGAETLPRLVRNLEASPELVNYFQRALRRALNSPMQNLRVERLLAVASAERPWYPKFLELNDPDVALRPYRWDGEIDEAELPFLETQYDGYTADPRFHSHYREFHRDWADRHRRQLTRVLNYPSSLEMLESLWRTPHPLTRENVMVALELMRDPMASAVLRGLRGHEFHLKIAESPQFNLWAGSRGGGERCELWSGYTVRGDFAYPQDTIVLRQVDTTSPEAFPQRVFERLVTLIHEYDHHIYRSDAESPDMALLHEEMSAHLRHHHFRVRHGSYQSVAEMLRRSPLGVGMYLRDRIEAEYFSETRSPELRANHPLEATEASLDAWLAQSLGDRATPALRRAALEIGRGLAAPEPFIRLLARSRIDSAETLEGSLHRLRHAVEFSEPGGLSGSYDNWVARLALDAIVRHRNPERFDALLARMANGFLRRDFEAWAAEFLPGFAMPGAPPPVPDHWTRPLSLDSEALRLLARFERFQGEIPRETLEQFRVRVLDPQSRPLMERVLESAARSPLAYLRLHRLFNVLSHEADVLPKLRELADPRARWQARAESEIFPLEIDPGYESAEDAYMGDPVFAAYLNEFYEAVPRLLRDPAGASRRAEGVLRGLWPQGGILDEAQVTAAFEALGDPLSRRVTAALRSGEVRLWVLDHEDFNQLARRFNGNDRGELWRGFSLSRSQGMDVDTIVVRQVRDVSPAVHWNVVLHRLATVLHEFEHHLRTPVSPRTPFSRLHEELPAHLRAEHFLASHGMVEGLREDLRDAPQGYALLLRDKIETWYSQRDGEER